MERYASYRDTSVPWLGAIPVTWETKRIKFILNNLDARRKPIEAVLRTTDGDTLYDYYGASGVIDQIDDYIFDETTILIGEDGANLVMRNLPLIYIATGCYWVNNHAHILVPKTGNDLRFMAYQMETVDYHDFITGAAQPKLTQNNLNNVILAVPSPEEQTMIAAYLDRRTAQIDTLIADLQSQAEMLDRYKRELIAETVTKGLNKAAAMKDSGVDWIGETPAHWDITKIKWMFEIVKRIYGKEDRDVLSITQRGIKVKDIESNDGQLAGSYANYQVVNANDFAMNSMDLLTGWVDCSPFEGVTSPDYRVFRFLSDKIQSHNYYKYIFQMCYKSRIFYRLGQGVSNLGRWRLQADQFLNMRLPQPPVEEQERIAAFLDEKTAKIETLIADINAQIEKLKQYRQIVIHDAVTGKIKVPEVNGNGN